LQRYLEKIVSRFIREASQLVEVKFNEASIVDETAQANIHEKYLVNGVVKPNEVRQELGKPQIDGLDTEKADQAKEQMQMQLDATAQQNDMKMQADAKAKHDAISNDKKDQNASQNASDSPTTSTGRNPKGSGAKQDGKSA
jgi:phosphosulfolactate synthase (CoM biosynthesis protein A)